MFILILCVNLLIIGFMFLCGIYLFFSLKVMLFLIEVLMNWLFGFWKIIFILFFIFLSVFLFIVVLFNFILLLVGLYKVISSLENVFLLELLCFKIVIYLLFFIFKLSFLIVLVCVLGYLNIKLVILIIMCLLYY